jgi:hypothetical protein
LGIQTSASPPLEPRPGSKPGPSAQPGAGNEGSWLGRGRVSQPSAPAGTGGKIKENTDYYNMVELLTQIGVMPAP